MSPAYRFDLKTILDAYKIREIEEAKMAEAIEPSLRNGNRPLVTVTKEDEQVKMFMETADQKNVSNS